MAILEIALLFNAPSFIAGGLTTAVPDTSTSPSKSKGLGFGYGVIPDLLLYLNIILNVSFLVVCCVGFLKVCSEDENRECTPKVSRVGQTPSSQSSFSDTH